MSLLDIDSETLGKVADMGAKFIGFVGLVWHFYRGRARDRRRKTAAAEEALEKQKAADDHAAIATQTVTTAAEFDERFVVGAVFNNLELSQQVETALRDLAIMTRDRDGLREHARQWKDLADEREALCGTERAENERLRRENARLLTERLVKEPPPAAPLQTAEDQAGRFQRLGIESQEQE